MKGFYEKTFLQSKAKKQNRQNRIADLGYFALSTFAAMLDKGVHFVSRLKYGVKLYDLNGKEIICQRGIEARFGKSISLLKLAQFIASNVTEIFYISTVKFKEQIARYCCYDTRQDRINMTDLITFFKY